MSQRYPTTTPEERETAVAAASLAIQRGGLVLMPTDTVYGLACRSAFRDAVRRIYDLKGRPSDKALPWLIPDADSASVFVNDHEPGLWHDILQWLEGTIAPWDPSRYRHNETGEDNAAAHLRSLTVGHEVIVPITDGRLDFGPWQRVFYGEWDGQRRKRVIIKVMGES